LVWLQGVGPDQRDYEIGDEGAHDEPQQPAMPSKSRDGEHGYDAENYDDECGGKPRSTRCDVHVFSIATGLGSDDVRLRARAMVTEWGNWEGRGSVKWG
jgi:hypothetical protein